MRRQLTQAEYDRLVRGWGGLTPRKKIQRAIEWHEVFRGAAATCTHCGGLFSPTGDAFAHPTFFEQTNEAAPFIGPFFDTTYNKVIVFALFGLCSAACIFERGGLPLPAQYQKQKHKQCNDD